MLETVSIEIAKNGVMFRMHDLLLSLFQAISKMASSFRPPVCECCGYRERQMYLRAYQHSKLRPDGEKGRGAEEEKVSSDNHGNN